MHGHQTADLGVVGDPRIVRELQHAAGGEGADVRVELVEVLAQRLLVDQLELGGLAQVVGDLRVGVLADVGGELQPVGDRLQRTDAQAEEAEQEAQGLVGGRQPVREGIDTLASEATRGHDGGRVAQINEGMGVLGGLKFHPFTLSPGSNLRNSKIQL